MTDNYDDIINLPYHGRQSGALSMYQRAAQFAPFAALTGHDSAIRETARLTDDFIELSDDNYMALDRKMSCLRAHLSESPLVTITYFLPDTKKSGGAYHTLTGNLHSIDDYNHLLLMSDGTKLPLSTVLDIDIHDSASSM